MQFVFVVKKNLTGKSGRKHAYLQYIFMNFYDKRCKLLILCAVYVHFSLLLFLRFVYKFDMFESQERTKKKKISINPFYGLARILRCVYCPVLFGILTTTHLYQNYKINANDVKPMQNPISCSIAFVLLNHLQ